MERNTDDVPFELFGQKGYIARKITDNNKRMDGKCGNIVYREIVIRWQLLRNS